VRLWSGKVPSSLCTAVRGGRANARSLDQTLVYRRYASLFLVFALSPSSGDYNNPLITLEMMHRYVQALDMYFGNVCELDIIFGFEKAYLLLDEMFLGGELVEPSFHAAVKAVRDMDGREQVDHLETALVASGLL
jgi:AP-1 complex subunit sigma 1/2